MNWAAHSKKEPFELGWTTTSEELTIIECPKCLGAHWEPKTKVEVPWITILGTGYAQGNFSARCPKCQQTFDREVRGLVTEFERQINVSNNKAICVRRFCDEARQVSSNPDDSVLA
jgi:hypothetical protein